MWNKNYMFMFLLSTSVSCHATSSDSDSTENEVLEDLERRTSRVAKCAGCKTPHSEHHLGPPNKLCIGDPTTLTNPNTRCRTPPPEESVRPKSKAKRGRKKAVRTEASLQALES